uniref:U4/U6 small nuclear ribonucleoprotein Prp31 n=1 Tax=Macrostomum lignano TaxID=282301 RepID=A0A1I8JQ39_9PLAT
SHSSCSKTASFAHARSSCRFTEELPGRYCEETAAAAADAIKEEPIDSRKFQQWRCTDSAAAAAAAAAQLAASAASGPVHCTRIAKLSDSEQLARVLGNRSKHSKLARSGRPAKFKGPYATRFPELETLVPSPVEYLQTVQQLGNNLCGARPSAPAPSRPYPGSSTIMVVSGDRFPLTISATTGRREAASDQELDWIMEACDMANKLLVQRERILSYVESRMQLIAPEFVCCCWRLGGSLIAGLCGLLPIFRSLAPPQAAIWFLQRHPGPPPRPSVRSAPLSLAAAPDLRSKAVRLIAAKCTLAARVDNFHQAPDGSRGRQLNMELELKFEKLTEPHRSNRCDLMGRAVVKPLTAPIDPPSKKRGGRRHRKMKERLGMTEMRKAANRIKFWRCSVGFNLVGRPQQRLECVPQAGTVENELLCQADVAALEWPDEPEHSRESGLGGPIVKSSAAFQQQLEAIVEAANSAQVDRGFDPWSRASPRVVRDCRPGQVHSRVAVGPEHCSGVGALESERSADWKVAVTGSQKKTESSRDGSACGRHTLGGALRNVSGLGHEQPGGSGVDPVAGEVQRRHPVVEGGSVDRSAEADQVLAHLQLCAKASTDGVAVVHGAVVPDEELRDAQVAVAAGGVQRRPAVDVAVFEFHAGVNQQLHRLDGGRTGGMEENLENVSPALPGRRVHGDHR